jgi:hypothetical protein
MGVGLLAVKSGFIYFIKNYQFPLQINTLERESALTNPKISLKNTMICQITSEEIKKKRVVKRETVEDPHKRCNSLRKHHVLSSILSVFPREQAE